MRNVVLVALLASTGCATIDRSHIGLSEGIEKGVAHQELKYMKLLDKYEKDSRDWVNVRMRFIDGPQIMKRAVEKTDFQKNVCKVKGALDQAFELLEFTLDASANFEKRKAKEIRELDEFFYRLRSKSREENGLLRQAASTLSTGLRAYVKGKERRKDVLRSWNLPVDQADALNKTAINIDEKMQKVIDRGRE